MTAPAEEAAAPPIITASNFFPSRARLRQWAPVAVALVAIAVYLERARERFRARRPRHHPEESARRLPERHLARLRASVLARRARRRPVPSIGDRELLARLVAFGRRSALVPRGEHPLARRGIGAGVVPRRGTARAGRRARRRALVRRASRARGSGRERRGPFGVHGGGLRDRRAARAPSRVVGRAGAVRARAALQGERGGVPGAGRAARSAVDRRRDGRASGAARIVPVVRRAGARLWRGAPGRVPPPAARRSVAGVRGCPSGGSLSHRRIRHPGVREAAPRARTSLRRLPAGRHRARHVGHVGRDRRRRSGGRARRGDIPRVAAGTGGRVRNGVGASDLDPRLERPLRDGSAARGTHAVPAQCRRDARGGLGDGTVRVARTARGGCGVGVGARDVLDAHVDAHRCLARSQDVRAHAARGTPGVVSRALDDGARGCGGGPVRRRGTRVRDGAGIVQARRRALAREW